MENKETIKDASIDSWINYEHVEGHLYSTSYRNGFEAGAQWQAERMYSREDLIDLIRNINYRNFNKYTVGMDEVDLFIEQFKKTKDEK